MKTLTLRTKYLIFFPLLGIVFLSITANSFGQEVNFLTGTGVAISVPLTGDGIEDGAIVASTEEGYKLSSYSYQPSIYGVITTTPALFLENGDPISANSFPVITTGKAYVNVSSANGVINKNDFITASDIPGVGVKATTNGFILGTALEGYNEENPESVGKILVYINPHFNATFIATRANIAESLRNVISSPFITPLTTMRYILAALVATGSFILGFIHFGRIVKTGIEALGRNPLASIFIQVSVLMNVVLTIGIVLAGLGIGYLILAL